MKRLTKEVLDSSPNTLAKAEIAKMPQLCNMPARTIFHLDLVVMADLKPRKKVYYSE